VPSNSLERHVRGQAEDSSQCAAPLEAVAAGDANVEGEPDAEGPEAGQEILDLEAHPSVEAIGAGKVGRSDAEIGREIHAVVEGEIESQGPQHTGDAVDCGIRPGGPGRGQAHRLLQARADRDKTVPQTRVAAQEERAVGMVSGDRGDAPHHHTEIDTGMPADRFVECRRVPGSRCGTDQYGQG